MSRIHTKKPIFDDMVTQTYSQVRNTSQPKMYSSQQLTSTSAFQFSSGYKRQPIFQLPKQPITIRTQMLTPTKLNETFSDFGKPIHFQLDDELTHRTESSIPLESRRSEIPVAKNDKNIQIAAIVTLSLFVIILVVKLVY